MRTADPPQVELPSAGAYRLAAPGGDNLFKKLKMGVGGAVTRMEQDRLPYILLHGDAHGLRGKEDRRKDGLMTFVMTVRASEFQYRKLLI